MSRFSWLSPACLLLLVTIPLVQAGCGGGRGAEEAFAVRDSAGVKIAENGASADGVGLWQVSSDPVLDIGALEGAPEYQLFRVFSAARLTNEHIVVANSGTHELRFYDVAGRHLRSVGREGDGPGEFRALGRILRLAGDTLVVYDSNLRRLSWFSPEGRFLRSASVGGDAAIIPLVTGAFDDNSLLAHAGVVFRPGANPTGVSRDSTRYFRVASDGALSDTLGSFLTPERYVGGDERMFYVTALPFGLTPTAATAGNGFFYGTGRDPEVGVYDEAGRLTRLVRWREPGRPVTTQDVDAEKAHQLAEASDANWRRRVEAMFAHLPIPETIPFYSSLVVDAGGDLWVGGFVAPDDSSRTWRIFDPEGRLVGRASTPAGLQVTQIGDDFVLGVWSDGMDVEHVRLLGLARRGLEAR